MMKVIAFASVLGTTFAGKCTEAESNLWIGQMSFTQLMYDCALDNLASPGPTTACIANGYPGKLSSDCASCFGETVRCGNEFCNQLCLDDASDPACLECTSRNGCDANLYTCTGFSQGPPKPTPSPSAGPTTTKQPLTAASATARASESPTNSTSTTSRASGMAIVSAGILVLTTFLSLAL